MPRSTIAVRTNRVDAYDAGRIEGASDVPFFPPSAAMPRHGKRLVECRLDQNRLRRPFCAQDTTARGRSEQDKIELDIVSACLLECGPQLRPPGGREEGENPSWSRRCNWERTPRRPLPIGGKARSIGDSPEARRPTQDTDCRSLVGWGTVRVKTRVQSSGSDVALGIFCLCAGRVRSHSSRRQPSAGGLPSLPFYCLHRQIPLEHSR